MSLHKLTLLLFAFALAATPALAQKTTAAIQAEITSTLVPNCSGCITATGLSSLLNDIATSYVNIPNITVKSVKDFGALGNSNGTTGNGNDDTTAISNAINNSGGGIVFFPCGTYRTTSLISNNTTGAIIQLVGSGPCSKIFNDALLATGTFQFAPASFCQACLLITGLNIIPPTHGGAGNYAFSITNEGGLIFQNNTINGSGAGLQLASSFAHKIINNQFLSISGSAISCASGDASMNNATISGNQFFTNGVSLSAPAVAACTSTGGLQFTGNDMENNFGAVLWAGAVKSAHIDANFLEGSTSFDFSITGSVSYSTINANNFGSAINNTFAHLQQTEFSRNDIGISSSTLTVSAAANVHDNLVQAGTFATNAATPTSCGASPTLSLRSTDYSGIVTTGSNSITACTVPFTGTYLNNPVCFASAVGNPNSGLAVTPSTTGILFAFTAQAFLQNFSYSCVFSD